MKKSLMILSISLILLISVSCVSASWFSDLFTGDVTTRGQFATTSKKEVASGDTSTSSTSNARTSLAKSGAAGYCPTGWTSTEAAGDGSCCVKGEKSAIGGVMSPPRKNPKI